MSIKDQTLVLEILRRIRNKQRAKSSERLECDTTSICCYFDRDPDVCKLSDRNSILFGLFDLWPKTTHSFAYPVPDPDHVCARAAYQRARHNGMWVGKYGALRMELLEWMIDHLSEKVRVL